MDAEGVEVPEELVTRLLQLAEVCRSLVAAWLEVGRELGDVPTSTTQAGTDAAQFAHFKSDGPPNVAFAPGQYAGLYVDAMGQQLQAVEALLRAQRLTLGPWPLVRAELEFAGRVAWLLEPKLGERSGERRVARFYLEVLSSLQRERFTAGKFDRARAKLVKREREAKLAEARSVFGEIDVDFSSMGKLAEWTIHGETLAGLGQGASLFVDVCFTNASALYDFLSDFSHPSLTALLRQTKKVEVDGVVRRPFVADGNAIEHQARLACVIFYKACHLVAAYYALDGAPLERWAGDAPSSWFNEEPGI